MTDNGRAPSGQALVASDGAATHLHPPGFDPSRYPLGKRLPSDFKLNWHGDYVSLAATCPTIHEIDAVVEALLLIRCALPATREALPEDLGIEAPELSYTERLAELFGLPPAASNGEAVPEDIRSGDHNTVAIAMETQRADTPESESVAKP